LPRPAGAWWVAREDWAASGGGLCLRPGDVAESLGPTRLVLARQSYGAAKVVPAVVAIQAGEPIRGLRVPVNEPRTTQVERGGPTAPAT